MCRRPQPLRVARNTHTQLQDRHPTTRVKSNYKTSTQLQEFHQMRTQSRNPSVFKIGLAEGQTEKDRTDTQLQDLHPTTRVPFLLQDFLSYYRSSVSTTGVPILLQELHPTTGVPIQLQELHPTTGVSIQLQELHPTTRVPILLQEFQSYYSSSILLQEFLPTTGVPILLQELHPTTGVPFLLLHEFQSYYRSSILLQEFLHTTGAPILLQEFHPTYKSRIQHISPRSNL